MTAPSRWLASIDVIPLAVAECCREWTVAFGMAPWGRCGLCDERPEFKRLLPEEEWLRADTIEG